MAFKKFGAAIVDQPRISLGEWGGIRRKAGLESSLKVDSNLLRLGEFAPDKYLLTHCTIISSVDVEPNGYYITPRTTKYVNSNDDAWERKLLLSAYPTFRGAENYLEHVQIPALSKGKILDAVARDLGDTVYVDILVATNRKHADLIKKIESGELTGLSMGCHVAYTICSKCGNKAHDETELCPHIQYGKGDLFIDEAGVERKVAELCGHHEDPESCIYIEASWVKNPAFVGAVKRGVIHSIDAETLANALQAKGVKNAHLHTNRIKKVAFDRKKPTEKNEPMPSVEETENREPQPYQNENLEPVSSWIATARQKLGSNTKISDEALFNYQKIVAVGTRKGWEALGKEITQRQFLTAVVLSDRTKGHKGLTPKLAKVLEATGPKSLYASEQTFLARCQDLVGRPLVQAEKQMLLTYGGLMGKFADNRQIVTV